MMDPRQASRFFSAPPPNVPRPTLIEVEQQSPSLGNGCLLSASTSPGFSSPNIPPVGFSSPRIQLQSGQQTPINNLKIDTSQPPPLLFQNQSTFPSTENTPTSSLFNPPMVCF